jgi:2-C-methyl-D-erythritol 2,4-cyclodiphosphate synthase
MAGIRVGTGFDAHALANGRPLILGGVTIPHPRGLAGHSDGDVLMHAVTSALLGAAALGDLGTHFPTDDPRYAGVDSGLLLGEVLRKMRVAGWRPVNVDATVIAQRPRIAPHVPAMRANLARILGIAPEAVSVKATTTDHLGFTGREEGIAAQAAVLIESTGS